MSKKKVSGSTMTLKDFHGGSIPSDLPLPSAPGAIVKPLDRSGYDRQSSWGNPLGRADYRSRPSLSPLTRSFDDKSPFLSPTAPIGRNFDEDERKPLDGVSAPRRMISDGTLSMSPVRAELKYDLVPSGRGSGPVLQVSSGTENTYSARVIGGNRKGVNTTNMGASSGQEAGGSYSNAWAARKEAEVVTEPDRSAWLETVAMSKLAHASALEKVSSGRWKTKPMDHQPDVDVNRHSEMDSESQMKACGNIFPRNALGAINGREYNDAAFTRHGEKVITVENRAQSGKSLTGYEKVSSPLHSDPKVGNPTSFTVGIQSVHAERNFGGSGLQQSVVLEAPERRKLNIPPRSTPSSISENQVVYKQGYQRHGDDIYAENISEACRVMDSAKLDTVPTDTDNRALERPKLILKPRSQSLQQMEVKVEEERNSLFGGARPREVVLKERGVDGVADNHEHPHRVKIEMVKEATGSGRTSGNPNAKAPNLQFTDRRDHHHVDGERAEMQKNRNWRGNRETEKQRERPPSPKTWRKPQQPQLPPRYGKAASAVELAQAFSGSTSDPKIAEKFSGQQKSLPGRAQVPFSRLTAPTTRHQVNGY